MIPAHTLDRTPSSSLPALREHLDRVRHDLGKYMVFQLRWLGAQPSLDDLRQALEADLVRTRSAGSLQQSAPRIWADLRPPLVGEQPLLDGSLVNLGLDPDLQAVDRGMEVIEGLLARLDVAPRAALEAGQAAAMDASAATRRLQQRVRNL